MHWRPYLAVAVLLAGMGGCIHKLRTIELAKQEATMAIPRKFFTADIVCSKIDGRHMQITGWYPEWSLRDGIGPIYSVTVGIRRNTTDTHTFESDGYVQEQPYANVAMYEFALEPCRE